MTIKTTKTVNKKQQTLGKGEEKEKEKEMEKNNLKLFKIIVYYRPIHVGGHMFILSDMFDFRCVLQLIYIKH